MKALVLRNQVVQISDAEFEVHPALTWVQIPVGSPVQVGWIYTGNDFVEPPPVSPGTGGQGGHGVGGDINIGGRGGDGLIGGAGGDGIGDGLNIGGRGGNARLPSAVHSHEEKKRPWWQGAWTIAIGIATIVGTVAAVVPLIR